MADLPLPEPLPDAVADPSTTRSSHGSALDPLPPPKTPPRAEPKFPQHTPYVFNSTPIRPSPNGWVFVQDQGRAQRLGLVDDTGMGAHFHQLGIQTFNSRIPGSSPAASDREKFFKPTIDKKGLSERAIGIELAKTIKSVLQAAGTSGLRVLHTPYHKAKGDHDENSDTVNDIGIYLDSEATRRVTTMRPEDHKKSKLSEEDLASGDFGRRSWYSMAALGEVKSLKYKECAFYMRPEGREEMESDDSDPPDEDNTETPDPDFGVPEPPSTTDTSHDGIADSADGLGGAPDPLGPATNVLNGKPFIGKPWKAESGLAQLGDYMHKFFTHQHRLFGYGFYVQWRWARLLYFDRTGALISEPFDWTETSSPLHDFVWKFAHMTPEQRGYDPTAQEASYAELSRVFAKANDKSLPKAIQPFVRDAFLSKDTQRNHSGETGLDWDLDESPIYKLTVTSSDPSSDERFPDSEPTPPSTDGPTTSERAFLVGRPKFVADSLIGRCTRGYIAFDLETEQFCFLKDSWRPRVFGRTRPEHLVYERLQSHGVRDRIATLVCGGDVGGCHQQLTETHAFFPQSKQPIPRVHYRIVVREIGVPLTDFITFGELNVVFLDAIIAHCMAWEKAGVLHRDISVGNILIDPVTRNGFLIDWDLSRLRSELEQGPVEPDRTGTWQFRSALCLAFPRKPYQLSDDIESFVHAYRWIVLRFHRTKIVGLRAFVEMEYEHSVKTKIPGVCVGGQFKLRSFAAPTPPFRVVNNVRLQGLLDDLAAGCYSHYQSIDRDLMETLYGIPDDTSELPQPEPVPTGALEAADIEDIMNWMAQARPPPAQDKHVSDVPPLQQSTQPPSNPCDVDGFLSSHFPLGNVFRKWMSNASPKHGDQFVLRCGEELVDPVFNVKPRGISTMSRSQTVDASVTASSSSGPNLKKRKQDDDAEADKAAPTAESNNAPPSEASDPTQAQVPKKQKKT